MKTDLSLGGGGFRRAMNQASGGLYPISIASMAQLNSSTPAVSERPFTELMRGVAEQRDRTQFKAVFDHFAPRVKSYLRRLGADDAMAEEVMQDVMLTVWRRAEQYDPEKSAVSTWIFTIARNRRIDVLRREKRPELDPNDPALVPEAEPRPDENLDAVELQQQLRSAIETLPPEQAELVRLSFFEGRSHSNIAEHLDLALGTVKSRLRLALSKLRVRMEECE